MLHQEKGKMITTNKGFRISFPLCLKEIVIGSAFNTCLAVLACKAENMNVVKSIPPLILFLISD